MSGNDKLHLIVNQISPSPEQLPAITARNADIAVVAGAGTGKTRTLVGRYLGLLAEAIPLRSIVAITFTNKAAREMRNRVREEIRTFLEGMGSEDSGFGFWQDIYQNLDAARISTIHSLAAEIIRGHPAELNIDPKFELIDEGLAGRLKARAVEYSLGMAARNPEASHLFVHFGDWTLRRLLTELLNKKLEVEDAITKIGDDPWSTWEPLLIQPIKEFIEHPVVKAGLNGLASLHENGIFRQAEEAGDLLVNDLRIAIIEWKKITNSRSDNDWKAASRSLGGLRSHLKQKGRAANWAPANPRKVIKEIQIIYDELISANNLDLDLDEELARKILPGLAVVFNYAADHYQKAKSQIYGLDYDDLEKKALVLLEEHEHVRNYWRSQIQALLVDEYQDTNDRQRKLVNLLNGDDRKLFIVGDGKQSIYRFRGANVAVFRQEQIRVGREGKKFQLNESYRAHPALIENLNKMLEPVLGLEDTIPYIEPFAELKPGRKESQRTLQSPFLEIHLAAGTKSTGGLILAAETLGSRILELVQADDNDSSGDGSRYTFGDIAVLCRAANSFTAYEAAFEKFGIPYLTIAGQGFYNRPEIRDLVNVLRVFSDPHDDLALAGFLRSPVGGLSDADLLFIRDYQLEHDLPGLLESARKQSGVEHFDRNEILTRALKLIDDFSNLAGRIAVPELLSEFLSRTGYLASYIHLGLERSAQNIKKLVSDAQQTGMTNIADFLDMITELRSVAVRESEAQTLSEGAVQIMSVHQAKGLEFPVVVLGDVTKRSRTGRGILIDERFGLVPPYQGDNIVIDDNGVAEVIKTSSFAYHLAAKEEQKREDAESNRLLYVAATRAEDLLIVNGAIRKPGKDQTLKNLGGWLGKLAPQLGLDGLEISIQPAGTEIHQRSLERPGLNASLNIYEMGLEYEIQPIVRSQKTTDPDLLIWEEPPIEPTPIAEEIDRGQLKRITHRSDDAPAWMVGSVVHRALELWKFPHQGDIEFLEWVIGELKKQGLAGEKEIKNGYRRVVDILERFCDHDLFQRMQKAEILRHEISFSILAQDNALKTGSIDAMFKEEDQWILVEFKTDEIRDQKRYNWIWANKDYQDQVEGYLFAAEKLLGSRPEPILCFLNYEKRVHLVKDAW